MKYAEFIQLKNITERLVDLCGIHRTETFYIQINHNPDCDFSSYDGFSGKDYVFKKSWSIPINMESVIHFEFGNQKIYHADDLQRMSDESGFTLDPDIASFLTRLSRENSEVLNINGTEIDELDEFKLQTIRVTGINNETREVRYDGTFFGDTTHIDPMDWALYSEITVRYIPNASFVPFYQALIGESYTLSYENKNNLSFFILFSAFECFINLKHHQNNPIEPETPIRLDEKLEQVFGYRFTDLPNHQIYVSLKPKFTEIKGLRNDIAHGKKPVNITDELLNKMFLFVLIFILSHDKKLNSFEELKAIVNKPTSGN